MMPAEQALWRLNRDMVLTWVVNIGLAVVVFVLLLLGNSSDFSPIFLVVIPILIWIVLAFQGMRETRNAMQWPILIASGRLEEAERQIEQSIRGFTLLRSVKLMSLHHLALVRMAQRRWQEAAALSRALLKYRMPRDRSVTNSVLLILGNAAIRTGDWQEAYRAIMQLRQQQLFLDEQLSLLSIECAYMARTGAWRELLHGIDAKTRLAELMPGELAAQTQGLLALGASRCGRTDWMMYLRDRCQLLCDPDRLCAEEPMLRELWEAKSA